VAAMHSCFGLVRHSSAWNSRRTEIGLQALCSLPFTAEAGTERPFERQLHATHILSEILFSVSSVFLSFFKGSFHSQFALNVFFFIDIRPVDTGSLHQKIKIIVS